jgi:hypothetical protein
MTPTSGAEFISRSTGVVEQPARHRLMAPNGAYGSAERDRAGSVPVAAGG